MRRPHLEIPEFWVDTGFHRGTGDEENIGNWIWRKKDNCHGHIHILEDGFSLHHDSGCMHIATFKQLDQACAAYALMFKEK